MKMFEVKTSSNSYFSPILKIAVCLVVVLICVFRKRIFRVSNQSAEVIIAIASFIAGIVAVLCIYTSVAEIMYVRDNRERESFRPPTLIECTVKTQDEVIQLLSNSDICEILAVNGNNIIRFGATSDCKNSDCDFFNKAYFIEESEYETIEEMRNALNEVFSDESIYVYSIDGITTKGTSTL